MFGILPLSFDGNDDFANDKSHGHKAVMLMYFSYTTLSTVGFGDLTPRSDHERLICSVVMVSGVAAFGFILNQLIDIIDQFRNFEAEIDEGNELRMFFGCLKQFNGGVDLPIEKIRKYEQYFEYRWMASKNSAIDDDEEKDRLDQLPEWT